MKLERRVLHFLKIGKGKAHYIALLEIHYVHLHIKVSEIHFGLFHQVFVQHLLTSLGLRMHSRT